MSSRVSLVQPSLLNFRERRWARRAAARGLTFIGLLLLLASSIQLLGCDSFERNAYRTLKVTKVEYELLQEEAARAFLDGRLTQQQWDRFAVAGNRFIAAHTMAADLMKTYQQVRRASSSPLEPGQEDASALEARVGAALAGLPPLLNDLRALLASFQPPAPAPPAQ